MQLGIVPGERLAPAARVYFASKCSVPRTCPLCARSAGPPGHLTVTSGQAKMSPNCGDAGHSASRAHSQADSPRIRPILACGTYVGWNAAIDLGGDRECRSRRNARVSRDGLKTVGSTDPAVEDVGPSTIDKRRARRPGHAGQARSSSWALHLDHGLRGWRRCDRRGGRVLRSASRSPAAREVAVRPFGEHGDCLAIM